MLDLARTNPLLTLQGAHTDIATEIPRLSDYEAVRTTITWNQRTNQHQQGPLRLSSLQPDIFHRILRQESMALQQLIPDQKGHIQHSLLENYARNISQAITNAMEAAMQRALPRRSGH